MQDPTTRPIGDLIQSGYLEPTPGPAMDGGAVWFAINTETPAQDLGHVLRSHEYSDWPDSVGRAPCPETQRFDS